jgi:hypothetical protein
MAAGSEKPLAAARPNPWAASAFPCRQKKLVKPQVVT